MKKSLSLALSLIMILATFTAMPFTALADDPTGTCGDCTWVYEEATKTLTVSGKGVVKYDSTCMNYAKVAETIIIGDEVTELADDSIYDIYAAKKVVIGASVEKLGKWAFDDGGVLEAFTVSPNNKNFVAVNGVVYNAAKTRLVLYPENKQDKKYTVLPGVKSIGYAAFYYAKNLEEVVLPEGLKKIDAEAFDYCEKLKKINFPSTLVSIGSYAFYCCTLIESVVLPSGFKSIGYGAFEECYGLKTIKLPEGLTFIGSYAFEDCDELTSLYIPGSATLAQYAVSYCDKLETLTIGKGMKVLPEYAIYDNSALKVIKIGEGMEEMEYECIYDNDYLEKVYLPDSIKKIDGNAIDSYASGFTIVASCNNYVAEDYSEYLYVGFEPTHKYDIKKVITPATLTSTGIRECICSGCGESKTEVLPKLKKNTLTAKGKTVKLKYSAKAQSVKAKKAVTVKKAQGKVSYKIAKKNKNFKVAKNGKITVKKGLKAGTYKVKVKVTAAGNISYAKGSKTVTVKIVVK